MLLPTAQADLSINLNSHGESKMISLTVAKFTGPQGEAMGKIIAQDLRLSGQFDIDESQLTLANNGIPNIREISLNKTSLTLVGHVFEKQVSYTLVDSISKKRLKTDTMPLGLLRKTAHTISNALYESITGAKGIFLTHIAFVQNNNLYVADFDGFNKQLIHASRQRLISPAWSPDGRYLAYVSFERNKPIVYIQDIKTRHRIIAANFKGNNSAPAWSPDGNTLAVALSRHALSNIYLIPSHKTAFNAQQITFSTQIDTEPVFFPNGSGIIFTSDRSGTPQLYRKGLSGGQAQRITFVGNQNVSPKISPDGKKVVYSTLRDGRYSIAIKTLGGSDEKAISSGPNDLSPSFAPNSTHILFLSNGQIGIANALNGQINYPNNLSKHITSAVWGPF